MNYRSDKHKRSIKNKSIFISVLSIVLVLGLSLVIANSLAMAIYKGSVYGNLQQDVIEDDVILESQERDEIGEEQDKSYASYENELLEDNLILFQGGVFTDLENAEEFKDNIEDKTLASIVNDGKYERIVLGVSTKDTFLDMVEMFKKNNIQFVKQVYKIPTDIKYNSEILEIIDLFTNFVLDNFEYILTDEFDITDFKQDVIDVEANYGKVGSYKQFKDLKDLILELDDEIVKEDLESIVDFIYFNFKDYKI